jgi:hypothetical protein
MDFDDLVEIKLNTPDDFLKIKETLTRIGICARNTNTLYQSCHILHKQGRYAITHFKEMFALDGKKTNITNEDISRRNTICDLLSQWNLCTIVDIKKIAEPKAPLNQIKIISFADKENWKLIAKYTIGQKFS